MIAQDFQNFSNSSLNNLKNSKGFGVKYFYLIELFIIFSYFFKEK